MSAVPGTATVEVLMFGAHPDDVEWAVGGIALRLQDEQVSSAIVDMTKGEMGSRGTVAQRKVEARKAADYLGISIRENLHLPDCSLVDSPGNRRQVASAIRRYKPKVVMAPLWDDRHPDHAAAGRMVQNSRLFCSLSKLDDPNPPHKPDAFLFYPIHTFHQPTFVIDTSAFYERKLELMRIYGSQFGSQVIEGVGDFLFRLESRDRYYGSLIGVHHGEALVADQPIPLGSLRGLLSLLT